MPTLPTFATRPTRSRCQAATPPRLNPWYGHLISLAVLRALADVAEHYPHLNADFSTYDYWGLLGWADGRKNSSIAVTLSFDILAKDPGFRIAMGKAYRKHGGDPSTFLSGPELTNAMAY